MSCWCYININCKYRDISNFSLVLTVLSLHIASDMVLDELVCSVVMFVLHASLFMVNNVLKLYSIVSVITLSYNYCGVMR